ncbi:MAG: hypothetical protein OHK0045_02250 [Raineya sp.]
MKPQLQFQIILGVIMVAVYLFGGIFVVFYAKDLFPDSKLPNVLGWVMIAYSFLRAMRVYEILKKKTQKKSKHNLGE